VNVSELGLSCVYNDRDGVGRIKILYFASKSEVLLVTVIFGNAKVYTIWTNEFVSG
jgi:hypothetical protein